MKIEIWKLKYNVNLRVLVLDEQPYTSWSNPGQLPWHAIVLDAVQTPHLRCLTFSMDRKSFSSWSHKIIVRVFDDRHSIYNELDEITWTLRGRLKDCSITPEQVGKILDPEVRGGWMENSILRIRRITLSQRG